MTRGQKGNVSTNALTKEDRKNFIILFSGGLVLRLYAFTQIHLISIDGAFQYIPVAKLFYQGDYLQALAQPQLPLYPFLIAIFSHITGDFELAGQLISIIFSLLAVFPIYLIGRSLFGPRAGFWTTILYLIHPLMLQCSVDVLKEGLLIFAFFSSVYCSLRFLQEGKGVWLLWTVAFAVVGALARILILEIFVALGLWLGYGALRGRAWERRLAYRYLWLLMIVVGISIMLVIPGILGWELWITKKPYNVAQWIWHRWFVYQWPSLLVVLKSSFKIVNRFIDQAYPLPCLLAIAGMGWSVKNKKFNAQEQYLVVVTALHILILFPFLYAATRYLFPAIFLLYLWAGFGLVKIRELIQQRFPRYPKLNAVIPIVILLLTILPITLQVPRGSKIGRKEVGFWLQGQSPPSSVILTNIPRVAYYAERESVFFSPQASAVEIVKEGRATGADYLVFEEEGSEISESFIPFEQKGEVKLIRRHPYGKEGKVIYVYTFGK